MGLFGSKACAVCLEKDARIVELKAQIEMLARLVLVPTSATNIPLVQVEGDAILSGKTEIEEVSPEQRKEFEDNISERDRILAGTY